MTSQSTKTRIETFKDYLKLLLDSMKVKSVSTDDAERLQKQLEREIRKIDRARGAFTHEWVTLKAKGRVVIPQNLRILIGAHEGTRFDCHLYPNPQNPRGIALIKER